MAKHTDKLQEIIQEIKRKEGSLEANSNVAEYILPEVVEKMQQNLEELFGEVLTTLLIDWQNDPNTMESPKRLAKMYLHEVMKGRYLKPPKITTFPNTYGLNELYTTGPIAVRSLCSHHLVPVIGDAWVGVIPGDKLVGLSKFNRVIEWVMSRPQIQEEGLVQIANFLEDELKPKGLIVVLKATHFCIHWRGVQDKSVMVNSVLRGLFAHNPSAKQEFFEIIKGQGYTNG